MLLVTLPRQNEKKNGGLGDAAGAAAFLQTQHVRSKLRSVVPLYAPAAVEDGGVQSDLIRKRRLHPFLRA